MKDKFLTIIIILFINIGCEMESNINGHWHIVNERGFPHEFATLDINDTVSLWGKVRYDDWIRSIIDKEKKIITLPLLEIYTEYLYSVINDTLILKEKKGETILFGIKKYKCSLESDYFASNMVDINLPIINDTMINHKDISAMSLHLLLGNPKEIIRNIYGDSTRLECHNEFVELEELELANMKHDIKVQKRYQDKISTLIYVDKYVSMKKLGKLVDKQRNINDRKIFLVGKRKNNSKTKNDLTFMPLERTLMIEKYENVEAWIKGISKNDVQSRNKE